MELQGRLQWDVNRVRVLREEERVHSGKAGDGPSHGDKLAKSPGKRRRELKASRHDYNQGKNQAINLKSQVVLLKGLKS